MNDLAEHTIWTIERHGADSRRGRWEASVAAVGPSGLSALAQLEGWARSTSATLTLQLIAETPPPEVLGELARDAVSLATEFGASRVVCPLGPCAHVVDDALEASRLDWRTLENGSSAYAEVTVSPVDASDET
jgi:hypothetical protein